MDFRVVRSYSSLAFALAAALSLAAMLPVAATARTWHVTVDGLGDAPTVQAGIDSAAVGDVVLVGPGTYRERITFLGKDITVMSESGPEATVLDGTGKSGTVVRFENGETRAAVLEGFTVTGGTGERAAGPDRNLWGGGIVIDSCSPSVLGNIVRGNHARDYGGGILTGGVTIVDPLIEGNTIRDNVAGTNGGGLGAEGGTIRNNVITDNECEDGDGAGIWIWTSDPVHVVVESNLILRNRAGDHGGGIYLALNGDGTAELTGNVIAHNWAGGRALSTRPGGGIYLGRGTHTLRNNTIVFNEGHFGSSTEAGGAIAIVQPGAQIIERNIIANTLHGGGIYCAAGLTPLIQNNLAWNNVGGDGVGDCAGWEQINGNIVGDPLLCDPGAGDYTVAKLSPALSHPAGPLGAFPDPGCDETPVERTSWGRLKQLYD